MTLSAPFPYFGSKRAAAPLIWAALGADVPNFVDACCGSASVLWARPAPGKVETLNDAFGQIVNFYRAIRKCPEEVAEHASWPVSELDMHARHRWLVEKVDETFVEQLRREPTFCDPEVAGWWVWGQSIWIGSGWCASNHRSGDEYSRPALSGGTSKIRKKPALCGHHAGREGYPKRGIGIFRDSLHQKIPALGAGEGHRPRSGVGINRRLPHLIGPNNRGKLKDQIPNLHGSDGSGVGHGRGIFSSTREDLVEYFAALSARLQRVRITCGDWKRVVTPAVTTSHGLTGVLLDPPYGEEAKRTKKLYAVDDVDTAEAMRAWCAKKGTDPHLRIVLCGYEGEHHDLEKLGWRCAPWKARGGYGNQDGENENARRERLWLSPHCLRSGEQVSLFGDLTEGAMA